MAPFPPPPLYDCHFPPLFNAASAPLPPPADLGRSASHSFPARMPFYRSRSEELPTGNNLFTPYQSRNNLFLGREQEKERMREERVREEVRRRILKEEVRQELEMERYYGSHPGFSYYGAWPAVQFDQQRYLDGCSTSSSRRQIRRKRKRDCYKSRRWSSEIPHKIVEITEGEQMLNSPISKDKVKPPNEEEIQKKMDRCAVQTEENANKVERDIPNIAHQVMGVTDDNVVLPQTSLRDEAQSPKKQEELRPRASLLGLPWPKDKIKPPPITNNRIREEIVREEVLRRILKEEVRRELEMERYYGLKHPDLGYHRTWPAVQFEQPRSMDRSKPNCLKSRWRWVREVPHKMEEIADGTLISKPPVSKDEVKPPNEEIQKEMDRQAVQTEENGNVDKKNVSKIMHKIMEATEGKVMLPQAVLKDKGKAQSPNNQEELRPEASLLELALPKDKIKLPPSTNSSENNENGNEVLKPEKKLAVRTEENGNKVEIAHKITGVTDNKVILPQALLKDKGKAQSPKNQEDLRPKASVELALPKGENMPKMSENGNEVLKPENGYEVEQVASCKFSKELFKEPEVCISKRKVDSISWHPNPANISSSTAKVASKKVKKQKINEKIEYTCHYCEVTVNNYSIWCGHLNGKRHAKMLKRLGPKNVTINNDPINLEGVMNNNSVGQEVVMKNNPISQELMMNNNPVSQEMVMKTNPVSQEGVMETNPDSQEVMMKNNLVSQEVVMDNNPFSRGVVIKTNPIIQEVVLNNNQIRQEVVMKNMPVSLEVVMNNIPVSQGVEMKNNPVSEEVVMKNNPVSQELVMKNNPISEEVVMNTNPVSREGVMETNLLSQEVMMKNNLVSQEVVMDYNPISRGVVVKTNPIIQEVALNNNPISREVAMTNMPVSQEVVMNNNPVSEGLVMENNPVNEEVVMQNNPVSEEVVMENNPISQVAMNNKSTPGVELAPGNLVLIPSGSLVFVPLIPLFPCTE